jgi:hypothetical protein
MQRGNVSYVKWARGLSRNEIREIAMDSDSDEEKYYVSQELGDEEGPRQPSRRSSVSQSFVLTETIFRIITQRPTYKTSFHLSSVQTAKASTTM